MMSDENLSFNFSDLNISFDGEVLSNDTTNSTTNGFIEIPIGIKVLMSIMYFAVTVAAVGGNGIVCYLVLAHRRMRTVTNLFIVNLAIGDIMMAVLCIPFTFIASLITMHWPFGAFMCPTVTYAQAVSVFLSAYTLVAISIDRYMAILYPLRPRMTKPQAFLIIVLVWLVSLITPLPTAIVASVQPIHGDYVHCSENWSPSKQYYYGMALMILQYFLPLSVLIFTYARIAAVVWGKKAPGEAEDVRDQRLASSKRKMVRMMITVVVIFTLCWLPLNILLVVAAKYDHLWQAKNIQYVWFVCHWLAMSHTCYNPAIYCWMNARFRDGFSHVLGCLIGREQTHRFEENGSLRRVNTSITMYTSVRTLSTRSGSRSGRDGSIQSRGSGGARELHVLRTNNHHFNTHHRHPLYDSDFTGESTI